RRNAVGSPIEPSPGESPNQSDPRSSFVRTRACARAFSLSSAWDGVGVALGVTNVASEVFAAPTLPAAEQAASTSSSPIAMDALRAPITRVYGPLDTGSMG